MQNYLEYLKLFILENSYADHYMTLKELELSFITDQLTGTYNRYILKELVTPLNKVKIF